MSNLINSMKAMFVRKAIDEYAAGASSKPDAKAQLTPSMEGDVEAWAKMFEASDKTGDVERAKKLREIFS